jgi:anaerobic magnesium-protoporphyrin IX monomethyl ester cyclase
VSKVLLINPPSAGTSYVSREGNIALSGIGYMAAYLEKHGLSCSIIDGKCEGLAIDDVCNRSISNCADLVGISSMTPDIIAAGKIAKNIKRSRPHTHIVVGGAHAIARPTETLQEFPEFDFIVIGEGEETLLELAKALSDNKDLDAIDGLVYRQNEDIKVNPHRHYLEDLDSLPFPAWDKFPLKGHTFGVVSARGCPYRCSFCMRALGQKVRERSAENVVEEISWLVNKFHARKIIFRDETFTLHVKRVIKITDLLLSKGLHKKIKWTAQTRVNCGNKEVFAQMKKAGCETIEFGVESGNQEVLGHPFETEESINDTINFAIKLKPHHLSFGIMSPYPGTKIWEMAQKGEGNYRLLSLNWEDFLRFGGGVLELKNLNRHRLEWLQMKSYLYFYLKTYNLIGLLQYGLPRWRQAKAVLQKFLTGYLK